MILKIKLWLSQPVDIASLIAYRILFGLLMLWGLGRFWWNGWIERSFVEPTFFFSYYGFSWLPSPHSLNIYAIFVLGILASILVTLGLFYRLASVVLFLSFFYIEFIDLSNYLNHYYLLILLSFLNIFLPLNRNLSLDCKFLGLPSWNQTPFGTLFLLRSQVAFVYFFAGIAKVGSDWLWEAQPINLWMSAHADLPLLGPWLTKTVVHYFMAWGGFLFDSTIWIFLLLPLTRPWAFVVVVVFHFFTWLFFPIGLFPFIMVSCATLLHSPSWPRAFLGKFLSVSTIPNSVLSNSALLFFSLFLASQIALPLRHFIYPSPLLWTEEGMRFSWKVMVREKNGSVTFKVVDRKSGRTWLVEPSHYLARHQEMEMAGQADMIWQLAKHIEKDFAREGRTVAIYADTWVALNGRAAAQLLDPNLDLTKQKDSLAPKTWFLPPPTDSPERLVAEK